MSSGSVLVRVTQDRSTATDNAALAGREQAAGGPMSSGKNFIRRPTRGIQIKEDTHATLRLVAMVGGQNKSLIDAGSRRPPGVVDGKNYTDIYSNFLIQAASEERQEKVQILETFGEPYIFLFGERPRTVTFQGVLLNTFDFNWEAEWWENYDRYLRGTQAVNSDARVYIQYDETLVGGYILGCSSQKTAGEPYHVGFTFQMFVTSYTNFSAIGSPDARKGNKLLASSNRESQATEVTLADALATAMRPVLADNETTASTITIQDISTLSLAESFKASYSTLVKDFSKTMSQVNNSVRSVAGQFSFTPIRIPVGFAGAATFDTDRVKVNFIDADYYVVNSKPLTVKYSVFSDNDDEYVGVSDHYGSSNELSFLNSVGFERLGDRLVFGDKLIQKLTEQWEAAGYEVDFTSMLDEARSFVDGTLGLVATNIAPIAVGVMQTAAYHLPTITSEKKQPPMHLAVAPESGKTITLTEPVPPPPPIGSAAPPPGAQIYNKATTPVP